MVHRHPRVGTIEIKRSYGRAVLDREANRFRQGLSPRAAIDIAAYCRQRCDTRQRLEMLGVAYISCMQDVANTIKCLQRFGAKQAMGIGDDTDAL